MTARVYCTCFDHRYLPRGLVMIRSLRRMELGASVWVLCLSPDAARILAELDEPGVTSVALGEFEQANPEVVKARYDGRTTIEYYFTLTPTLVAHVMARAGAGIVTYLDADLYFFAPPAPIHAEMADASVQIIPHGFAPHMRHLEKYGTYNVGWLSFRDDARGRACLEWWRTSANDWCREELDIANGRYCEQGYLDQFPKRFQGVHVLAHHGANLAPWNVAASQLSLRGGQVFVNDDPLIFFHFHGLKRLESGEFLTAHGLYKAPLSPLMRQALYRPYLAELLAFDAAIVDRFGVPDRSSVRNVHGTQGGLPARLKGRIRMLLNRWRGYIIAPG